MKKFLLPLIALAFIACQDNSNVSTVTSNPYDKTITGTLSVGDTPQWTTVGNLSLSQMLVIVDQYGVPTTMAEGDQLAAFVGDECRGTAKAFNDANNKWRFNLVVHATTADEDLSKLQFTLRYYSTKEGGLYTSNLIGYEDDAIFGSNTKGYVPTWK